MYSILKLSLRIASYFHKSQKVYDDLKIINNKGKRIKQMSDTRFIFILDLMKSISNLEEELRYVVTKESCNWDVGTYLHSNSVLCRDLMLVFLKIYFYENVINKNSEVRKFITSNIINRINQLFNIENTLFLLIYYLNNRYKGILKSVWKNVAANSLINIFFRIGIDEDFKLELVNYFEFILKHQSWIFIQLHFGVLIIRAINMKKG